MKKIFNRPKIASGNANVHSHLVLKKKNLEHFLSNFFENVKTKKDSSTEDNLMEGRAGIKKDVGRKKSIKAASLYGTVW